VAALACAGALLTGCSDVADDGGTQQGDRLASPDTRDPSGSEGTPPSGGANAAGLVERALAARAANDSTEFAALLSAASRQCPDADAARRLGEVAAIAARWSAAVQDGRPKAQAVTEAQLAKVDWDALAASCRES
jgi:hypothetical protein